MTVVADMKRATWTILLLLGAAALIALLIWVSVSTDKVGDAAQEAGQFDIGSRLPAAPRMWTS